MDAWSGASSICICMHACMHAWLRRAESQHLRPNFYTCASTILLHACMPAQNAFCSKMLLLPCCCAVHCRRLHQALWRGVGGAGGLAAPLVQGLSPVARQHVWDLQRAERRGGGGCGCRPGRRSGQAAGAGALTAGIVTQYCRCLFLLSNVVQPWCAAACSLELQSSSPILAVLGVRVAIGCRCNIFPWSVQEPCHAEHESCRGGTI